MGITGQSTISSIINRAYGKKYRLNPNEFIAPSGLSPYGIGLRSIGALNPFRRLKTLHKGYLILVSALVLMFLKAAISVYYFNMLVNTQQNMLAAHGNVQALVQRRNDIATNLSKAVLDYSKHERGVFTAVVSLRKFFTESGAGAADTLKQLQNYYKTAAGGAAPQTGITGNPDILSALSKLVAVAEQYPDLKLSANFETLMAALVQVEQDLAKQRIKFNQEANIYTTLITKVPGNLFAWVFGFKIVDYFEADDQAKAFRVIGY
ncbi:Magnetosomen protein MamQ [Candidatus Desulfarcum epimagneticum]|uniref:Magnetosomen protein MamQ n=1 Tax=uncultured Desulfobacteraceae bacterium TaxID=218296 RepID=A0A484HFW6_9BACT|nr:Magnetosomen protein MamQ [uncultured Desulfobacteraceae bacterium]